MHGLGAHLDAGNELVGSGASEEQHPLKLREPLVIPLRQRQGVRLGLQAEGWEVHSAGRGVGGTRC